MLYSFLQDISRGVGEEADGRNIERDVTHIDFWPSGEGAFKSMR